MKKINNKSKKFSTNFINNEVKSLLIHRDKEVLKQLFVEINPYLIRVCATNSIHKEHADEVIHETWASFFAHLENFEGRSNIRTYICGILFNKIREYRRDQGKFSFKEDSEQAINQAFTIQGWWNVEPTDPHKVSELKQAAEFVKDCMEGLSDQQKVAFVMREVEDENSDDICNVLNINITHLRVLIFRAKDKLRKCLDGKISSTESQ